MAKRQKGRMTERRKDLKTKRQNDKNTKTQKDKNTRRQKDKKKENIFFELSTGVITSYSSKTDVSLVFFLCGLSTVPDMSTHSLTMRQ